MIAIAGCARALVAGLVLSLALACGGSSPAPPASPRAEGAASTEPAQPGAADPAADAPGAPVDEAECSRLADHLVEISMHEPRNRPARGAGAEAYSAEDAEVAKRELRQTLQPMCAQLSRRDYACAMAAKTSAEMAACQPAQR